MSRTVHQHHDEYRFPNLGIAIRVGRCESGVDWIQTEIPDDLFSARIDEWRWPILGEVECPETLRAQRRHQIANGLHIAAMALDIVQSKIDEGDKDSQHFLDMALESLTELEYLSSKINDSE